MESDPRGDILLAADRAVWVVTSAHGAQRGGLTATWVLPASLDPGRPVVLLGLAPHHHTTALVEGSGRLVLHLLRRDQAALARHFGLASGHDVDKLRDTPYEPDDRGIPQLKDCLARIVAEVFARLDAGDRLFFWCDVVDGSWISPPTDALRETQVLDGADEATRTRLAEARRRDMERLAPRGTQWREQLPDLLRFQPPLDDG